MAIRGAVFSSFVFSTSLLLVGCGGSTPAAESPADAESSDGVGKASEPAAPRNLKPAPAPSGVVGKMRISNMAAIADSVMEAASIPFDWRRLLKKDPESAPFINVVDWEGSIEGLAAMNAQRPQSPHGVISIGVTGTDKVLDMLDAENIAALEGPGEVYYFEIGGEDCAVGPAISGSPARVVCADRRPSLDMLLPYALRGFPQEELSKSDVHLQFEMGPVRDAFGKEMKTALRWAPAAARTQHQKNPTFDKALSDGAQLVTHEGTALIDELQTITFQLSQKSGDFTGSFSVELKGDQSDTVKVLQDLQRRQEDVPAAFEVLPASASAAGYSREVSAEIAGKWMSIIADLAQGGLELEGASKPFASRVGKLINGLGPKGKVGVYARGPLVETKNKKGEAQMGPAWVVSGMTRKKGDVVKILEDASWIMGSSDLKKLADKDDILPKFKRKRTNIAGAPGAAVYEWELPPEFLIAARMLGSQAGGAIDTDDLVETAEELVNGLVAVWEYEGVTWVSWGTDKAEVAKSFAAVKDPQAKRMKSLGAVHGLRSEPAAAAGFSTLQGLVGMASFLFPPEIVKEWPGIEQAMPNGGKTPVVYRFDVQGSGSTTATWKVHVPAKFTQDVAALAVMAAAQSKKPLSPPPAD